MTYKDNKQNQKMFRYIFAFFPNNKPLSNAELYRFFCKTFGNRPYIARDFLVCFNNENKDFFHKEKKGDKYSSINDPLIIFGKKSLFSSSAARELFYKHDDDLERIYNAIHNVEEEEWLTKEQNETLNKIKTDVTNSSDQCKYLWIKGPAGAGKTLCAYHLFGYLRGHHSSKSVFNDNVWLLINNAYMWSQIHCQDKERNKHHNTKYYIPISNTTSYGALQYVNVDLCKDKIKTEWKGRECYYKRPYDLLEIKKDNKDKNDRFLYWTHNVLANILNLPNVRYVIIDECQRIGKEGINLNKLVEKVASFSGKIIFFGDVNQRLYNSDVEFVKDIWEKLPLEKCKTYTLAKPQRVPESIDKWAKNICKNKENIIDMKCPITSEYKIECSSKLEDLKDWNYKKNIPIFCLPTFWLIGNPIDSLKNKDVRDGAMSIPLTNRHSQVLIGTREWEKYDVYTLYHKHYLKPWAITQNINKYIFNVNDVISRTISEIIIYIDKDFFIHKNESNVNCKKNTMTIRQEVIEPSSHFINYLSNMFYILLTRSQFGVFLFFEDENDIRLFQSSFNKSIETDKYWFIVKGYIQIESELRRLIPNWLSIVSSNNKFMSDYLKNKELITKDINDKIHKIRKLSNSIKHSDLTESFSKDVDNIKQSDIDNILNELRKI